MAYSRLNTSLIRQGETWLRKASNASYNEPQSFRMLLLSGSVTNASTWVQILGAELTETNGYSRQTITFSAGNLVSNTVTFDSNTAQVTASGSNLTFDSVVLVADAASTANKSVVSMTASTDYINVASHGLSNGDAVMFTGAGTIATGLSKDTIYYVRDISGNDFKVEATVGGGAINLTADSSGSLLCRYANGWAEIYETYGSTQTILTSVPHSFVIHWNIIRG